MASEHLDTESPERPLRGPGVEPTPPIHGRSRTRHPTRASGEGAHLRENWVEGLSRVVGSRAGDYHDTVSPKESMIFGQRSRKAVKIAIGLLTLGILTLCVTPTWAQLAIDTTRFTAPIPVPGDIPGLYRWANSTQSDSAEVVILSPTEGQEFSAGDSIFALVSVSGLAIGAQTHGAEVTGLANSTGGQYVCVSLGQGPCIPSFTSGQPLFVGIATPGAHSIFAFACRSWHESVKSSGSFKSVTIYVTDTSDAPHQDQEPPTGASRLILNRPEGVYLGSDGKAILIDFFLTGAMSSDRSRGVRLTVNAASSVFDRWVPHIITGLPPGAHTFRLELLQADGSVAIGAPTAAEKSIVIK